MNVGRITSVDLQKAWEFKNLMFFICKKTRTNFHKTIDKIKIYGKINSLKIKI